jgi:hypothetical protein
MTRLRSSFALTLAISCIKLLLVPLLHKGQLALLLSQEIRQSWWYWWWQMGWSKIVLEWLNSSIQMAQVFSVTELPRLKLEVSTLPLNTLSYLLVIKALSRFSSSVFRA